MSLKILDQPCKIEEVFSLTFSVENLHKYLDFLINNDKEFVYSLNELSKEVSGKADDLDDIKARVNRCEDKLYAVDDKFNENERNLQKQINVFNEKFNNIDITANRNNKVKYIKIE